MKSAYFLIALLVVLAVLLAGCTQSQQTPQPVSQTTAVPTVRVDTVRGTSTTAGTILVDASGRTLYFFAKDEPGNGTSACSGGCASLWPPFHTDTITVTPPLSAADFGSFARADGTKQTTYRGRPLYYFQQDGSAGDIRGQGYGNVWFVANVNGTLPPTPTPAPTTLHTLSPSGGGSY